MKYSCCQDSFVIESWFCYLVFDWRKRRTWQSQRDSSVSAFLKVHSGQLFHTLGARGFFMRGFRFRSSLKKWPARKASGTERYCFDGAEPITTPLKPKHPESGCFGDWFLGDIECFKCSDWITITIGAWPGRECFEGDKDQIQTIQVHIRYVFAFWKRIGNIRCLY